MDGRLFIHFCFTGVNRTELNGKKQVLCSLLSHPNAANNCAVPRSVIHPFYSVITGLKIIG